MKQVCILILLSSEPVFSNSTSPTDSIRTGPSLDVSGGFGLFGIVYDLAVEYQSETMLYGVRSLGSNEITFELAGLSTESRPLESVWEVDAYLGKHFSFPGFRLSGLVGLSITGGIQRGDLVSSINFLGVRNQYESLEGTVIGVPIQGQVRIMPDDHFGISISYLININSRKTFRGFIFALQLSAH